MNSLKVKRKRKIRFLCLSGSGLLLGMEVFIKLRKESGTAMEEDVADYLLYHNKIILYHIIFISIY